MKKEIKLLCLSAAFCVVCVFCSAISIPTPFGVPLTLAPFAFCLVGLCLPIKNALLCYFSYLLLGVCGVPVFSSFSGGLGILLGKNGGFIIGYIFIVILSSLYRRKSLLLGSVFSSLGVIICHLLGVSYLSFVTDTPFVSALLVASVPFLFKDIVLCVLAQLLKGKIMRFLVD